MLFISQEKQYLNTCEWLCFNKQNSSTLIFEIQIISMCHLKGRIPLLKYLSYLADHANTGNGEDSAFSEYFVDLQLGKKKTHYVYRNFPTYVCLVVQSPTIVTPRSVVRRPLFMGLSGQEYTDTFPHPAIIISCGVPWTLDNAFLTEFLVMMGMFYICSYDMVVTRHVS